MILHADILSLPQIKNNLFVGNMVQLIEYFLACMNLWIESLAPYKL